MSNNIWDRREEFLGYMEKTFGYALIDWAEIDDHAPIKSVRTAATEFLGKSVKISNDEAKEILEASQGAEMYRSGNIRFFDPNVFLVLVASYVEV